MTSFEIARIRFNRANVDAWAGSDPHHTNWPVVYALNDDKQIYVGESRGAAYRLRQHLDNPSKQHLTTAQIVLHDEFNKSACHDLESHLIRWMSGDGVYEVINSNAGISEADYFRRDEYRESFREIFDELKDIGLFQRSIPEIENSDLFKLSPFKALTPDQQAAVESILEALVQDLRAGRPSQLVIQGEPGTGKTVVAIYLMKLISDIGRATEDDLPDEDTRFAEFFQSAVRDALQGLRVGLVVPQQSLRKSVQRVFRKTPGLDPAQVIDPFAVGEASQPFDLLIVDEAHRLSQRAAQAFGTLTKKFGEITSALFGKDDPLRTQLDWIEAQSRHQILLIDADQTVRPADLPRAQVEAVANRARRDRRLHTLTSQLRLNAGEDYVPHIKSLLSGVASGPRDFPTYDLRFFDDLSEMRAEIIRSEAEAGLARLLAGYAWDWVSRGNAEAFDIELDGIQLPWNRSAVDWVHSRTSIDEVGSIHTIQGYDLNYAGVIIGPDLVMDPETKQVKFDRANYFDRRGKANNRMRGITYTDDDLLAYVQNIYAVLLTRGIKGTFVYVCDPVLREFMRENL